MGALPGGTYTFTVDGIEYSRRILSAMEAKAANREMRKCMRAGAVPLAAAVRKNLPPKMKKAGRAVKIKNMKSAAVRVGPYTKVMEMQTGTDYMDVYYLIYWHNYGTLANRNPQYQFDTPRKSKTAAWQGGIRARGFIERTYDQTVSIVKMKTNQAIQASIIDAWDKNRKTVQ